GWGEPGGYWGGAPWGSYGFTTLEPPNTTIADRIYQCKTTTWPGAPCTSLTGTDNTVVFARSYHSGGAQAFFADGVVALMSESVDPVVYRALGTRAGGEVPRGY
ncbi:MAG TPA: DUF1559 domain-containing protein, partial [Pirellulales bacterium]